MSEGSGSNGFGQTAVNKLTKPLMDTLPNSLDDEKVMVEENEGSIFTKIRFQWRPEDAAIIQRIDNLVDQEFYNNFGDVIPTLDRLYCSLRVPLMQEVGEPDVNGKRQVMPVLDHKKRQVFEADPDNPSRAREDFSQLTGQDICEALMGLERIRLDAVPRVAKLLSDAIYAKMVAGDMHDEKWFAIYDGTISDKTSATNRETQPDRYHAHFRYCLWLTSKEFLDEIGRFMDRLEKIGTWKSFER